MSKRDYEVGYGKPPKKHQFKPGQSGNPKGRPKGRKNMATLIQNVLDRKVVVKQNGRERKISFSEAFIEAFAQKAINGTTRDMVAAMKTIHEYMPEAFTPSDLPTEIRMVLVESDGNGREKVIPLPKHHEGYQERDSSDAAWRASGLADEDDEAPRES